MSENVDDITAIPERYARRTNNEIYSMLRTEVYLAQQERLIAMIDYIRGMDRPLEDLVLVDLGCGNGGNLLDFLRIGFAPNNLIGLELLEDRVAKTRQLMPQGVRLISGDAAQAPIADGSVDIVFQSVVFSSLLNDDFQQEMANAMWRWLKPGGAILWYDFIYDNPNNQDVKGISRRRVQQLFPASKAKFKSTTLAPPIARRVARFGRFVHNVLRALPFLRTHIMAWIKK